MKQRNLILVRHGQSEWNEKNLFTGWEDPGLTNKGKLEAENAGNLIKNLGITFGYLFTSALIRAQLTGTIILSQINQEGIPIFKDKALNERFYGDLQGLNKDECREKWGEEQVQIWRRSFDTPPPMAKENSKNDPKTHKLYNDIKSELPLGESLKDVVLRVTNTFEQLLALTKEKCVLVVAHGNSIRAMVKMLDNLSDNEIVDVNIPTGIPLAYNISDNNIEKIGYLGDKDTIKNLAKEVELQSKITNKKG